MVFFNLKLQVQESSILQNPIFFLFNDRESHTGFGWYWVNNHKDDFKAYEVATVHWIPM